MVISAVPLVSSEWAHAYNVQLTTSRDRGQMKLKRDLNKNVFRLFSRLSKTYFIVFIFSMKDIYNILFKTMSKKDFEDNVKTHDK